jgi:H3 lysine-79-specific histone-lysine N-methyltransferase
MSRSLVEVNLALGRINKNLKALPPLASLRVKLTEVALEQAYRRCVKPHLDLLKLRSKQTWSDEVYGELMPELLEEIFVRANLGKNSLFVDLGSGVGNVVAQASLSTGCASFGIEIRSGPATIAKSLLDEVEARGRIWGLRAGQMDIAEGDALFDGVVKRTVPTADLVLLNNKVWSASRE